MKLSKRTRYCSIVVIFLGVAVIGHAVVADRSMAAHPRSEIKEAARR